MTFVNNLISSVAHRALKSWLQQRGLRHSAANQEALVALIERLIDDANPALDDLKSGVREIEEHQRKAALLLPLTH